MTSFNFRLMIIINILKPYINILILDFSKKILKRSMILKINKMMNINYKISKKINYKIKKKKI